MSENTNGGTVITGEGITFVHAAQIVHGLALEVNTGMRLSSRGSVMNLARERCGSPKRTKKGVLRDYVSWMQQQYPHWTPSDSITRAMAK